MIKGRMMTMRVNRIDIVKNNFKYNIDVVVKLNTNTPYLFQILQSQLGSFFVNLRILRKNSCFGKVSGLVSPSAIIFFYRYMNQFEHVVKNQLSNTVKPYVHIFYLRVIIRVDGQFDRNPIVGYKKSSVQIRLFVSKLFQTIFEKYLFFCGVTTTHILYFSG